MSSVLEMRTGNGVTVRLFDAFAEDGEIACQAVLQAMEGIHWAKTVASEPLGRDTTSLPEQNQKEE